MLEPKRHVLAVVTAMSLLSLVACDEDKKKEAERNAVQRNQQGAVDRALAAPGTSLAVQGGKDAMVAQQCAIRCQAVPGIDPSACGPKCRAACAVEKDTAGIDACALKVAEQSPKM